MTNALGTARPTAAFWHDRRVLVTGHTGFKGSWLTCWLRSLGAKVMGVSLPEPPTVPSLWEALEIDDLSEVRMDITTDDLIAAASSFSPEIVFHLAAQSLVSVGYEQPARTFDVNVQGTVKVLEMLDSLSDVLATVVVTTDKVYDPRQPAPHSEAHYLAGIDPYSASKAAAELVVRGWPLTPSPRATARAGNVIGGGDWAPHRILPDIVRAWESGKPVELRNPEGVRPWQHVLEPLRGYLVYAEALTSSGDLPMSLNFGPADMQSVSVADLVRFAGAEWIRLGGSLPNPQSIVQEDSQFSETGELTLDSRLARAALNWGSVLDWRESVTLTLEWYWQEHAGTRPADLIVTQLEAYLSRIGKAS